VAAQRHQGARTKVERRKERWWAAMASYEITPELAGGNSVLAATSVIVLAQ